MAAFAGPHSHQADEEQLLNVSPTRTRTREVDEACAAAVDLAQAAADRDGRCLARWARTSALQSDGDRVVTHLFACLDPAYMGWRWAVTVARASRAKVVTVDECVLLPGPDSLLAPDWVPWSERVRPGDLGVGDLMPAPSDDERLVPVASLEGDDGVLDWDDAAPGKRAAVISPRRSATPSRRAGRAAGRPRGP